MLYVIFFSLLGGLVSLIGAVTLFSNKKHAEKLASYGTPFAAGVLLATAFTDLLPEALEEQSSVRGILSATLIGMLLFFMIERYIRWFHHHHEHVKSQTTPSSLIIIGDTIHNALDGVAIAAAFLINVPTGIITTLAVAAHEIPQEIGDFSLLLNNGMRRKKVLLVNIMSALATTIVAVVIYAIGDRNGLPLPYLLALTAGFFIYIASSDIIPEIHEDLTPGKRDVRPWILLLGALLVLLISPIAHSFIEKSHTSNHDSMHQ